jgi:hypothetical protein
MPRIPFEELPDHGRLWVFPLTRDLTDEERASTLGVVDAFLDQWAAHGVPLRSGRRLADGRFLLVGVDIDAEAPSGCSIDALVNRLRAHGTELGVSFIDHAPIWFRSPDGVRMVSRAEFRALVEEGVATPDTRVFDTSLTKVAQVRGRGLERPASDCWHGRVYFKERAEA